MMDLIVGWPKQTDYPWFRAMIGKYRAYFREVFIVWTQDTVGNDVRPWIIQRMNNVRFIKPQPKEEDWRNNAMRDVLQFSEADYVLFIEQDFLFHEVVLQTVRGALENADFIFYQEDKRIHPAFACVRRELIEKTSKDFSAKPPAYDHFGLFFREAKQESWAYVELRELLLQERKDFYHLGGLTQNYENFRAGQPFYKPNDFLAYNHHSIQMGTDPNLLYLWEGIEKTYGSGEKDGFIKDFFEEVNDDGRNL